MEDPAITARKNNYLDALYPQLMNYIVNALGVDVIPNPNPNQAPTFQQVPPKLDINFKIDNNLSNYFYLIDLLFNDTYDLKSKILRDDELAPSFRVDNILADFQNVDRIKTILRNSLNWDAIKY